MGFFVVTMHRRVQIHPRFFGVKLRDTLTQRLMIEVEGTFAGRYGFVIAVLQVNEPIPDGELDDGTGNAVFPLKYQAVVFRPFKGEVLDSLVSKVTPHGFFAESGPLTIFVSHHLLPEGMAFDIETATWKSSDGEDVVAKNSKVRLRIIGLKIDAAEIAATGSIQDPYLGPIE